MIKFVRQTHFKYDVVELRAVDSKIDSTTPPQRDTYIFGNQIKSLRYK